MELLITVALSMWAVTFYDSNDSDLVQAWIQGRTIVGGLCVFAVFWLAVVFVALAPRALNRDARNELRAYQVGTPVLEIGAPEPSYGRIVDSGPSTVWGVSVRNATPLTIAHNVQVTIQQGRPYGLTIFPVMLHQAVKVDYYSGQFIEERHIRNGDTVAYDLFSEPFRRDGKPNDLSSLGWHSTEINNNDVVGSLDVKTLSFLEAMIEREGYFDFLIRAVADPPVPVAERWVRLRKMYTGGGGDSGLYDFELCDPQDPTSQPNPSTSDVQPIDGAVSKSVHALAFGVSVAAGTTTIAPVPPCERPLNAVRA